MLISIFLALNKGIHIPYVECGARSFQERDIRLALYFLLASPKFHIFLAFAGLVCGSEGEY